MAWRAAIALSVVAWALPWGAGAQDRSAQAAAADPYWLSSAKQANVANCVVNIGTAAIFLGKAGLAINAAVQNCDTEGGTTAACTAAVSGVVGSFSLVAGFISGAAAECRSSLQVVDQRAVLTEACAADTAIITGVLALVVNAGATVKGTCPGAQLQEPVSPAAAEAFDSGVRRLQASPSSSSSSVDAAERRRLAALGGNKTLLYEKLERASRQLAAHGFFAPKGKGKSKAKKEGPPPAVRTPAQDAACAFDVGQATFLSAKAGLMINYAVKDCSATALYEGGNINQAKCITDVGFVIGAFGFAASGIAFSVFECPDIIDNLDAACAGAIINLVAGTAMLVSISADLSTTCAELGKNDATIANDLRNVADPERRLAATALAGDYLV